MLPGFWVVVVRVRWSGEEEDDLQTLRVLRSEERGKEGKPPWLDVRGCARAGV